MDLVPLFLSWRGRISRGAFGRGVLGIVAALFVLYFAISLPLAALGFDPFEAVSRGLVLAAYYPLSCLYAKRLHDFDRSAWWMFAAWAPGWALWLFEIPAVEALGGAVPALPVGLWVLSWLLPLAMLFVCAFVQGSKGPNRFGEPADRFDAAAAKAFR